jgi:hypothetical protein
MGEFAQKPVLFIDGDESFTKTGIERTIGSEVSMNREKNYDFYAKFDAINRFALNNELLRSGKTEILTFEENGFVSWIITKDNSDKALLVVANWLPLTEKVSETDENGETVQNIKEGIPIFDKVLNIPEGYKLLSEYVFDKECHYFVEIEKSHENTLHFDRLKASEFKIFKLCI